MDLMISDEIFNTKKFWKEKNIDLIYKKLFLWPELINDSYVRLFAIRKTSFTQKKPITYLYLKGIPLLLVIVGQFWPHPQTVPTNLFVLVFKLTFSNVSFYEHMFSNLPIISSILQFTLYAYFSRMGKNSLIILLTKI